jgi:hypothetical protein
VYKQHNTAIPEHYNSPQPRLNLIHFLPQFIINLAISFIIPHCEDMLCRSLISIYLAICLTSLLHLILVLGYKTPHYTMYHSLTLTSLPFLPQLYFPSRMQVHMGQTANGRGTIPITSRVHRHYYGSSPSCRGSMASPHVRLVGWVGRLELRACKRSVLVPSPANFCCSTQATPGVSDPARHWVWICSDCSAVGVV